ncbi:MAG: methylated-DNA--[protein]-cysteine S-methyltransferase [Burkholderiales bacterium]
MIPTRPVENRTTRLTSPLGDILLAYESDALTGLYFEGQKHQPAWLAATPGDEQHPIARAPALWLEDYFSGKAAAAPPPLKLRGTPFQQAVWRALQTIPRGQTLSYAQIAQTAGTPRAVRAVGAAIGRNPVSILVPCHRVVGRDGSLTGYAGGLERKAALLRLEGIRPA